MTRPVAHDEQTDDPVLRNFLGADGRLHAVPAKRTKRLVVLDRIAQSFEPGLTYPEQDVNAILTCYHADYAMLRRLLVDEGFLTREHSADTVDMVDWVYWRSGGAVES